MPQSAATLPPLATDSPTILTIERLSAGTPVEGAQTEKDWGFPNRGSGADAPKVLIYEQWSGAGIPPPIELYRPQVQPQPIIDSSARAMLTDRVQATLDRLFDLLTREAQRNYMPVTRTEVAGFIDPEEGTQEVVVMQLVNVPPRAALDYWDRLGAAIEVWIESLPERLKSVAIERIAVEVRWNIDDRAT